MTPILSTPALLVTALLARHAVAAPTPARTAVDRTLAQRQVTLAGAEDGAWLLTGPGGPERADTSAFLALLPATAGAHAGTPLADPMVWLNAAGPDRRGIPAVLSLTDGRVLLGRLPDADGTSTEPGETLHIDTDALGRVGVPLDLVAALTLRATARPADARDTIVLRNGDALTGYILSIDGAVEIEADAGVSRVPLATVSGIALANPPAAPRHDTVTLADGSVLGVLSLEAAPAGRVGLALAPIDPASDADSEAAPPATTITVPAHEVVAWRAGPGRQTLHALASLGTPDHAPAPGRRWTRPPVVEPATAGDLPSVLLPGPMDATWALPPGATGVAATVELAGGNARWAGCEVRLEAATPAGPRVLGAVTLTPEAPSHDLRADLPSRATSLTVRVLPGQRGPVQDSVRLVRPMVLVEQWSSEQ